jgi:hypothetical protein
MDVIDLEQGDLQQERRNAGQNLSRLQIISTIRYKLADQNRQNLIQKGSLSLH